MVVAYFKVYYIVRPDKKDEHSNETTARELIYSECSTNKGNNNSCTFAPKFLSWRRKSYNFSLSNG
jgi:hypothetical protein